MGFIKGKKCRSCESTLLKKHSITGQTYCFVCCDSTRELMLRSKELCILGLESYEEAVKLIGRESGLSERILSRIATWYCTDSGYIESGYDEALDRLVRYVSENGTALMVAHEANKITPRISRDAQELTLKDISEAIKGLNEIIKEVKERGKEIPLRHDGRTSRRSEHSGEGQAPEPNSPAASGQSHSELSEV